MAVLVAAQSVKSALARLLIGMAGVYTLQSLIGGLMNAGLPTFLRNQGLGLDAIGLLSVLMLPWVFKFLWAGPIERWRLHNRSPKTALAQGQISRSSWFILISQLLIVALLVVCSAFNPILSFSLLLTLLGVMAILSSTTDIAADGFMIERLAPNQRGWGNVIQVSGGYAGAAIGGGAFLILTEYYGWRNAINYLALVGFVLGLLFIASAGLHTSDTHAGETNQSLNDHSYKPSLWRALKRPEIQTGLLFVALAQLGLRLTIGLSGPFMIDQGFAMSDIGGLASTYGFFFSLLSIYITGLSIKRWEASAALYVLIIFQLTLFASFFIAAIHSFSAIFLKFLYVSSMAVLAASFVALYTLMTGWVSAKQPGIDFTLFQSTDMLIGVVAGITSGMLAEYFGYQASFSIAATASAILLVSFTALLNRIHHNIQQGRL